MYECRNLAFVHVYRVPYVLTTTRLIQTTDLCKFYATMVTAYLHPNVKLHHTTNKELVLHVVGCSALIKTSPSKVKHRALPQSLKSWQGQH